MDMSARNTNALPLGELRRPEGWRANVSRFVELGKPRLSSLVVLTAVAGFVVGTSGPLNWWQLAWTALGTALAAFGANTLNQRFEIARDQAMKRTRARPLPTRRVSRQAALRLGFFTGLAGPMLLAVLVNELAALLALAAFGIYVWLYTPLKPVTTTNTLIGGVVGALPPMVGWAAASGGLPLGAWVLGLILFLWQIPHFLALAWMFRDDYARGGLRMLPVLDAPGHLTACVVVVYSLALVPVTLLLPLLGVVGGYFAVGAVALGVFQAAAAVAMERQRTTAAARRMFFAGLAYLSLLMILMLVDRQ